MRIIPHILKNAFRNTSAEAVFHRQSANFGGHLDYLSSSFNHLQDIQCVYGIS